MAFLWAFLYLKFEKIIEDILKSKLLEEWDMGKEREELEKIFEIANDSFLRNNRMLFETKVSERTLCGALMLELHEVLRKVFWILCRCWI